MVRPYGCCLGALAAGVSSRQPGFPLCSRSRGPSSPFSGCPFVDRSGVAQKSLGEKGLCTFGVLSVLHLQGSHVQWVRSEQAQPPLEASARLIGEHRRS